MLQLSNQVAEWARDCLEPACASYQRRREANNHARHEDEAFIANLEHRSLTDRAHRQEMAQLVAHVADVHLPLLELLDQIDSVSAVGDVRALGAARQYLPQVVQVMRQDVKEYLSRSEQAAFWKDVTLEKFQQCQVVKERFPVDAPEYEFIREVMTAHRAIGRGLRTHFHARKPVDSVLTDASLDWTLDSDLVHARAQDLVGRTRELAKDLQKFFATEDKQHAALDGQKLRSLSQQLCSMADIVWSIPLSMACTEVSLRHTVKESVEEQLDDLLKNLNEKSADSVRSDLQVARKMLLKAKSTLQPADPPPSKAIHGAMKSEIATRVHRRLTSWKAEYEAVVDAVRRKWAPIDEGLERIGRHWDDLDQKSEDLTHDGKLTFVQVYPAEAAKNEYSFKECFEERQRQWFSWAAKEVAIVNGLQLIKDMEKALQPSTTMAKILHSHDWRVEVDRVWQDWHCEIPDDVQRQIDEQHQTSNEARDALRIDVEGEWRKWLKDAGDEMRRVADIMSDKHKVWESTGRGARLHQLYETRLNMLRPVSPDDKILWAECWGKLVSDWPTELNRNRWAWDEEEVRDYRLSLETGRHGPTRALVSWVQMQRTVLMRQCDLA